MNTAGVDGVSMKQNLAIDLAKDVTNVMTKTVAVAKDVTKTNNGPNTKTANSRMINCTLKGMSTSSGLFAMVRLLGPIIDHSKSKKLILSFLEYVDQARIC